MSESDAQPTRTHPPPVRRAGPSRVWLLNLAVAVVAVLLGVVAIRRTALDGPLVVPWLVLAALFYGAELAVVHLRFRRDAHSFSMSEIPLVIGLFLASPLALLTAQLAGNLAALTVNRRQPPVKLAFNLGQFSLQGVLAVLVFHGVLGSAAPDGPLGWTAALLATLIAVLTGDTLVNAAIRLSGGRIDRTEMLQVMGFGVLAAEMNTTLALIGVVLLWSNPEAVWLAAGPLLVLFLAYRAYTSQREESARLASLYEATRILHEAPHLERALTASVRHARSMFEADVVEVVMLPDRRGGPGLRTMAGPDDRLESMVRAEAPSEDWLAELAHRGRIVTVGSSSQARDAIAVPMTGERGLIGYVAVRDRLSDISSFGEQDLMLLEAFAQQVAVSVENSRLGDSLAEVTELKEQLEDLVRSKDRFVASVSHELRTPLTAVVGLTEELKANLDAFSRVEIEELVALIAGQSSELANIVEDLLVGARADIGTLVVSPQPVRVDDEVAAVLSSSHGALASVHVDVEGTGGRALADPLRLRQVLRNMLTNAARYGGDKIYLRYVHDGDTVTTIVADDGPGVPPGDEERIFMPYERAHSPGTQPDSVGLGLAVSRQLARLMGGDLTYARRNGLTEFSLSLPRVDSGIRGTDTVEGAAAS